LSLRSLQLVLVVAAVAPIVVTGELFWTAAAALIIIGATIGFPLD
jgi:hypothetical protein